MIGSFIRLMFVIVVIAAAVAFFLGYRWGNGGIVRPASDPVGTVGRDVPLDTSKAREAGAAIGEKVATAANAAGDLLEDGQLTAKIKSKMTLDDLVQARTIDVDTRDGVVTVSGRVRTEAERQRALQLARETVGVKTVIDRLVVQAR
ncbi:MAG: BON domain-containing protein [Vicinamibacterales bacterium]